MKGENTIDQVGVIINVKTEIVDYTNVCKEILQEVGSHSGD
jgi:hypothetical protein